MNWDIYNLEQEISKDPEQLNKNKDSILNSYISGLQEIANGNIPCSWTERTHLLFRAIDLYPVPLQQQLKEIRNHADLQLSYIEQQASLNVLVGGLEARQKNIESFLQNYSGY